MRTIRRTHQFKKDYKREKKSHHRLSLDTDLSRIVHALSADIPLPVKHYDHALG
jgi:mRNA-degrading endonuclease YafQ of YafQ-DinJ toxin-antitoxin module